MAKISKIVMAVTVKELAARLAEAVKEGYGDLPIGSPYFGDNTDADRYVLGACIRFEEKYAAMEHARGCGTGDILGESK